MNRPPSHTVPVFFASLSLAGLLFCLIVGSNGGLFALGLAVAVVAGSLAIASWRQARALTTAEPATVQWWKFLAGGTIVIATVIGVTKVTGEVAESWWWPTMITVLFGLVTIAAGLVLGVAHLTGKRLRNSSN